MTIDLVVGGGEMSYNDIIRYIEDKKVLVNKDYYFHAFTYQQLSFVNMIDEGIKAPILLHKKAEGYNGYFYVSLFKCNPCEMSIYKLVKHLPMFMINDQLKTIKTRNSIRNGFFPIPMSMTNTPLPFRLSVYDDEYQKFLKVNSQDIISIQYNISSQESSNEEIKYKLSVLQSMVRDLNMQNRDLPIIDGFTQKQINQEKVLSLKI